MSEPVFGGYTPHQLEEQYNARAAVPGYEKIFLDWRERSESYRQRSPCELDISYGPSDRQTLDLFIPGRGGSPVLVFIHGGYWRLMDKSDFSYLAEGFVERGGLVAVVNYGLCPAVTIDEIVRQMRTACEWLWRNCREYGGNPDRIHVSGHSAGGQLSAMLMATDWPSFSPDLPSELVKSGIPVSGLFELEPMRFLSLNEDLKLDKESASRNSPSLLYPKTKAPLSVVVGGAESEEFRRQSYSFTQKWRERGVNAEYVEMEGLNHFTVLDQMKSPGSPLTDIILQHMGLG
ncbi:MAG: alpha/beta hydrolase [Deltaproteobacteria bacterium]|nr:MAG: alpha/beta hydrolase [Deltaproteobacteria bacterium]